jgi:nuclear transcription Y subunit beta
VYLIHVFLLFVVHFVLFYRIASYHNHPLPTIMSHPDDSDSDGGHSPTGHVREQDRYLPIANISRIMKRALPPNAKISKDAKETVQECVSEFISFITSEYVNRSFWLVLFCVVVAHWWCWCRASEKCAQEKRKTINGDDILWAMNNLGFDNYIEPLKAYLNKYREVCFVCQHHHTTHTHSLSLHLPWNMRLMHMC